MALVDYSGSEDSDEEPKSKDAPPAKVKPNPSKPVFQKLVDSSNPGKITVTLPDTKRQPGVNDDQGSELPAKKSRTGPSSFSGFNSFLPAPKRAVVSGAATNAGGKGLASGVSLKTGANPGFSRDVGAAPSDWDNEEVGAVRSLDDEENNINRLLEEPTATAPVKEITEPPKKKATIFKPLSVARKPRQRPTPDVDSAAITTNGVSKSIPQSSPQPAPLRTSLFSVGDTSEISSDSSSAINRTYKPMLYQETPSLPMSAASQQPSEPTITQAPDRSQERQDDTLTSIASDLNLSKSAKRQLLGRKARQTGLSTSATTIVNFNTDAEYAANEAMRQSGETIQHNPVRAIAPGKHSLKQLVNAATNQHDALEEHFAAGKRNRSEAGAKYGW